MYSAIISTTGEQHIVQEVTTARITWSDVNKNVPGMMGQEKIINGQLGSIYGVMVYVTQNTGQVTLTALADINYVLADGGLGAMGFKQMKPEIIINDVNSPYKNVNSIAWHAQFNAALIDAARVIKIYSDPNAAA
jgi:hypothetical protein